jgi:membrane protein
MSAAPPKAKRRAPSRLGGAERSPGAARPMPDVIAHALGRNAEGPLGMPWRGWKSAFRRTCQDMITDRASLVAAGCAFYATLALFPAISMLLSLYGLVFDPKSVEPHLEILSDLLPPSAFTLISERVHLLAANPPRLLSLNLLVSTSITVWSATTGTKSLIAAINHAYDEPERRTVLRYQVTAFALTILTMVGATLGLAALVALPAMMGILGVSANRQILIQAMGFVLTLLFVVLALSVAYRYGPCRKPAKWRWVAPGSIIATLLWAAASMLFSFYVRDFATYNAVYGSFGAVVGVMMWFFVSAYVVLFGAQLNAELELQTARDTTQGPPLPMGARGARVADRVAED